MNKLGANTWIWVSPLTDERLTQLAPRVRDMGFDVVELPIEQLGDWSPEHAAEVLAEHGLGASIAVAMAPGRELCGADADTVATTQAFLRECLDVAATVGAGAIAGPIYTSTGRTWRITPDDRASLYAELRENLKPVAEHAGEVGVKIGIEPLVRYETSLINTVEQALEAIDPLPDSVGLLLDTYHANVEEKDFAGSFGTTADWANPRPPARKRMSNTLTRTPCPSGLSVQNGKRDQTRNARMFGDDSRAAATSSLSSFFEIFSGSIVSDVDHHENVPVS